MNLRPLLLLEINEVPWRLVDKAVAGGRHPHIARFFGRAAQHTTVNTDVGELSPWVTWPSLHRGMNNEEHGVFHLGQDVRTFKGKPIWQEYRDVGKTIGVCGSLQSWPPVDPGPGGFYVPDTFAHDEACIPRFLEPIQRFNLGQVRKNGRVVKSRLPLSKDELAVLPAILRAQLPLRFYWEVARQLLRERLDDRTVARRTTFQTLLYWAIFKRLYRPTAAPAFATFFTNHVASVMHRYWADTFPEDFPEKDPKAFRHADTMEFALDVLDEILGDALAMQAQRPDILLAFASSMGQAAVHREHHGRELVVTDVTKLVEALGAPAQSFKPLLAMVPQVAIDMPDDADRARLKARLLASRTVDDEALFQVAEEGRSLSITIVTPRAGAIDAGYFAEAGRRLVWASVGIEVVATDAGTAYHVPEGTLALVGQGIAPDVRRGTMLATAVKSYLLETTGLRPPIGRSERSPRQPGAAAAKADVVL